MAADWTPVLGIGVEGEGGMGGGGCIDAFLTAEFNKIACPPAWITGLCDDRGVPGVNEVVPLLSHCRIGPEILNQSRST